MQQVCGKVSNYFSKFLGSFCSFFFWSLIQIAALRFSETALKKERPELKRSDLMMRTGSDGRNNTQRLPGAELGSEMRPDLIQPDELRRCRVLEGTQGPGWGLTAGASGFLWPGHVQVSVPPRLGHAGGHGDISAAWISEKFVLGFLFGDLLAL